MKTAAVFFVVLLQLGAHAVDCGLYSYSPGFRNNWCRDYCLGSEWGADAPDFCHSQPCSSRVKANARSFSTASEPNEASCQDSCQARADCAAYLYDFESKLCAFVPSFMLVGLDKSPGVNAFALKFCDGEPPKTVVPPMVDSIFPQGEADNCHDLFSYTPAVDNEWCRGFCDGELVGTAMPASCRLDGCSTNIRDRWGPVPSSSGCFGQVLKTMACSRPSASPMGRLDGRRSREEQRRHQIV
eukprot:Polyplicarium_translucidae@DN3272_c0_g1_i1.p1